METFVVSDLHLSDAEPLDPKRPHWKAYKRREFFIDEDFSALLHHVEQEASGPLELVLNGDVFDFDNITQVPDEPAGEIDWLGRRRGLASEEWMSLFKIERIISDHQEWFDDLGAFVRRGHRVVVVIGNHDVELHWPRVQKRVREALGLAEDPSMVGPRDDGEDGRGQLVFCDWFYISEGDTFISHGHQYDTNCSTKSAIDPLVSIHGRPQVRIPFGDLAERYMLNGMGYFNPHATQSFLMTGREYVAFFYRHLLRTQPLLLWTWFWGALATFVLAVRGSWRPVMRDPLLVEEKVAAIARRSQGTPSMVRQLHALNVPSACTNPLRIMRELWLDRGLLLIGVFFLAWHVVLTVNFLSPISPAWVLLALALLLAPYFLYAFSVHPTVFAEPLLTEERARLISAITGARRVVFGHTHEPGQWHVGSVAYFNGGFWSQAFADPACTQRIGTQTFVWIRPESRGAAPEPGDAGGLGYRRAELYEWPPGGKAPRVYRPQ